MIKNILASIFLILLGVSFVCAQNTVGLISYDPGQTYDGYNLIYPHNQSTVYLLNNCGEIVHTWTDDPDLRPGNTAYLMPNGNLVKTKRPAAVGNDPIWAGGGGAIVEIRSWNNDLLWSFEMNDADNRLHHDIEVTPAGTILMIAWERKSMAEAIQAGRDTALIPDGEVWSEWVLEVDPNTDEIIWEWHLWDHLVQDYDPTKDNFGVISEHPELVDINFTSNNGGRDWIHANAIDFHPELNQIMISTPFLREIWIVDHSTTAAQAAGHFGGLSGRGGDLMYRYGNPQVYDAGTADDQVLFNNHDAEWVLDFVDQSHPYFGKISVFNNQAGPDYSTFNVLTPPWDMYLWYYEMTGDAWGPDEFDLDLTHPEPTAVYSTGLSSVQHLPNGNILVTSGRQGYSFELTPDHDIVWEYITPLVGGMPAAQGDILQLSDNMTFRMDRYPTGYEAFDGRDLSAKGWIELNPDSNFCDQILPVYSEIEDHRLRLFPNPASDKVVIEWDGGVYVDVAVFDLMGRQVIRPMRLTGGRKYLDVSTLKNGMYFVRINGQQSGKLMISR